MQKLKVESMGHSALRGHGAGNWAPVMIAAQSEPTSEQNHCKEKTELNTHCLQEPAGSAKPARHA